MLRVSATSQSYVFLWQDGNVRRRMVLDVRPDQGEKLRPGDDDGLSLREARKMAKALRHKLDMIEGFDPTAPDENARTFNWLAQ